MKKQILLIMGAFWLVAGVAVAQNMTSPNTWTIGSGNVGMFIQNGSTQENIREWGNGPFGRTILWKSIPDGSNSADGGFTTSFLPIDHTKMYRLSIWLKKTGSHSGNSYLGPRTNSAAGQPQLTSLAGTESSNPYFFFADLPELDKWYLVVGYVHGSGDPSTTKLSGIYDALTGEKVIQLSDYKFQEGTTSLCLRTYQYYVTEINCIQYFYAPRMEEVNGDEPTIEALLGIKTQMAVAGSELYPSKMGVNTTADKMGSYELAVNGEIRANEIKVETGWADFVFEEDYKLMSLEELEAYIKVNKHLPVIPSAKEVEANGVRLGEMDKLLLQKIEELSLYIIEQNKLIKKQGEQLEELKNKISEKE